MSEFLVVMQIVALASLSALCIYLILVLSRIRIVMESVERDIREVSSKAIPVFENLETITSKIKDVTESIDEQVTMVKDSIRTIKDVTENIVRFEKRIQSRIEEPVMDTVSFFVSLIKGVRTFLDRLRA